MALASSPLSKLLLSLFLTYVALSISKIQAQVEETTSLKLMLSDALEWPLSTSFDLNDNEDMDDEEMDDEAENEYNRRSLFWKRMKYYISYGALSANRIPCPPRSGRSYYTHNCFNAHGPVHPYSRGCSRITRCRR